MDTSLLETERTYIRLIVRLSVGLVVFVFIVWSASRFYYGWQEGRVLRRAATLLSSGDVRAAGLSARRALQFNPESLPAARMLGQIAETAGAPVALEWRQKAVQLAPDSMEDQIALAKCAISFEDLDVAKRALSAVNDETKTASYYAAAAQLAEVQREPAAAREHWEKAVQLAPGNKTYKMRLAVVNLAAPDSTMRATAHTALEELRGDPNERVAATRALIADEATNRQDPEKLLSLTRELQEYPEAAFSDTLAYLDLLRQLRPADFDSFLAKVEQKALTKPQYLAGLISSMNRSGLSARALKYSRELNSEVLKQWPVPLALAESYSVAGDWAGLEQSTVTRSWRGFEFLRRAYLARAFREQGKKVDAEREWNAATKEAANQPRSLAVLTRTVIDWQWTDEAIDLLWTLARNPTEQTDALRSLYRHYSDTGDTRGLYRTLQRLVDASPGDLTFQNNFAQIGLLLNAEPARARKLAATLYREKPNEPAYVSTYAFSLFANGDARGAVSAMEALTDDQLRDPALAAYFGIFLAMAGQLEKAREYLDRGSEARLLPEERALLEKARNKLK